MDSEASSADTPGAAAFRWAEGTVDVGGEHLSLWHDEFPHPGGEHDMSGRTTRPWQSASAPHRRTFLQAAGTYRATPTGADVQAEVAVWAEWEAETRLLAELDPVPAGPRWLCQPNPAGTPPQNTDPFVFGDRFRYSACR